jgi:hypothetical protein
VPSADLAVSDGATDPEGVEHAPEPTNAELAEAGARPASPVRVSRVSSRSQPDVRPVSEGGSKRPQPQNKPRSQRKK